MALWEFKNLNKYGNFRTRIIHTEGSLSIPGSAFGPVVFARRFRYEYKHSYLPPTLLELNGKKYLMPLWQEVDKGTTIDDINWVKPKPKKKRTEPIIETFTSGSSDNVYTTKYYPDSGKFYCSCPGSWRTQGNCKHIKELKNEINKDKK